MHMISSVSATDPSLPYTPIAKKEVNKIVSAPTKPGQTNPPSFQTMWLGQAGWTAPLPAEDLAAAVSSPGRCTALPRTGCEKATHGTEETSLSICPHFCQYSWPHCLPHPSWS